VEFFYIFMDILGAGMAYRNDKGIVVQGQKDGAFSSRSSQK